MLLFNRHNFFFYLILLWYHLMIACQFYLSFNFMIIITNINFFDL